MSVLTGQSLDRKLATEEAEIAEIVQGFLTLQARAAATRPAASPCNPRERRVRASRSSRSLTSPRGAIRRWRHGSPGASTPGPVSTPPR